jgi:hypothetical protein
MGHISSGGAQPTVAWRFPIRAAFARPGPTATPFPDVLARMQPSDSLPPSAAAPVPLAGGLPRCGRLFCASTGRRHVRPPTRRASETGHRLSAKPECVEERRGPPRLLDRPLRACSGRTPRRIRAPLAPLSQRCVVAFDEVQHSRHPERL